MSRLGCRCGEAARRRLHECRALLVPPERLLGLVTANRLGREVAQVRLAHAGASLLAGAQPPEFRTHEAALPLTGGRHYNTLTSAQSDSRSVSGPRLRALR